MPDAQMPPDDKAPYLSLTTLTNFFDRWGDGPIPPRIDKSPLDRYSGGTQSLMLNTLRLMGYVDQEGRVLPALRDAIQDVDARKAHLEAWARQFYATQIGLAEEHATSQMLHESFATFGYSGSTLRKAIVFYLALVDYVGLPNSPMFSAPRQSATPPSRRRRVRNGPSSAPPEHVSPSRPIREPSGEVSVIEIDDLATITITVDAQWMKLPVQTITAMREAIDQLVALGTSELS